MPSTLRMAPEAASSPALRAMSRMLEGLSDPTMLLNRDLEIIFANAEARMRFVNSNLTLRLGFTSFLESAFAGCDVAGLARTLHTVVAAPPGEPSTYSLRESDREVQLRITNVELDSAADSDPA